MPNILPLGKVINASRFNLAAAAFDIINFHASGPFPPNLTLNPDTPKGVLGGSVAVADADYEATLADHTANPPLGIFSDNSEGNAFENAPAPASGVVAIFMSGGFFETFIFETNSADAPYPDITPLYIVGHLLYTSPFGLLTPELPAAHPDHPGGVNSIVALITKAPSPTDLRLGFKLLI